MVQIDLRSWHKGCFEYKGMSVESIVVGDNEVMARKLMDSMTIIQEGCSSNLANMDNPDFHKFSIDKNFDLQLNEMMEEGDLEGMEELVPALIEANRPWGSECGAIIDVKS